MAHLKCRCQAIQLTYGTAAIVYAVDSLRKVVRQARPNGYYDDPELLFTMVFLEEALDDSDIQTT